MLKHAKLVIELRCRYVEHCAYAVQCFPPILIMKRVLAVFTVPDGDSLAPSNTHRRRGVITPRSVKFG